MKTKHIAISLLLMCVAVGDAAAQKKRYFTAAVYEHARWGDGTSAKPPVVLKENLKRYGKAANAAKWRGADIIVFPEYGLFPPSDREKLRSYLEEIPDPKAARANPCDEPYKFIDRPILYTLSCFAQSNEIVIVANTGGFEECTGQPNCSSDGRWHFNANVVFNRDGTLLARYYKERLYFEDGMDLPKTTQDPFFRTDFGKFAMFICFDIIFEQMAKVGEMEGIDAVFFSTFWVNSFPFYTSTQWWQAWAIGSNTTILAANLHIPGLSATGSGIYDARMSGDASIRADASTIRQDGVSKLLISAVAKRNEHLTSPLPTIFALKERGTKEPKDGDGEFQPICSYKKLGKAKDIRKDYRCWEEDVSNYTLAKLPGTEGRVEACNNNMCCHLEYKAQTMDENYYLGVFNGTYNSSNRYHWAEESCFVARCDDADGVSCAIFPTVSNTHFVHLYLSANFSTSHVYPSVVGHQYDLLPYRDWSFSKALNESSLEFKRAQNYPLLSATLKGRAYDRDPPYVR